MEDSSWSITIERASSESKTESFAGSKVDRPGSQEIARTRTEGCWDLIAYPFRAVLTVGLMSVSVVLCVLSETYNHIGLQSPHGAVSTRLKHPF